MTIAATNADWFQVDNGWLTLVSHGKDQHLASAHLPAEVQLAYKTTVASLCRLKDYLNLPVGNNLTL